MLRRAVAAATKAAPMCAEINPTSLHNNLIQRRWAKITADNLKVGMLVEHDGRRMQVMSYKAAMMGRRPTSLHIDLKDLTTGKVYPTRFMPSDTIEEMVVEKVDYSFLYVQDGLAYVMHPDTFDQLEFNASIIGDKAHYIAPNSKVVLSLYQGQVIAVRGPEEVVVTVADTDEKVQSGDNSKAATLENGRVIKVPKHITKGQKIKIRVADESFLGKVEDK